MSTESANSVPGVGKDEKMPDENVVRNFVESTLHSKGGLKQLCYGFWHKTLPVMMGNCREVTLPRLLSLVLRLVVLVAAAVFPLLLRMAATASQTAPAPKGLDRLFELIFRADSADFWLGGIAIVLALSPRIFDFFGKGREVGESPSHYYDLSAAIKELPRCSCPETQEIDQSLRLALQALKGKVCHLIGDPEGTRLTDVTLLEYCDNSGERMQVRVRTAAHEDVKKPIASRRFLASYVAEAGRWFVLHDFISQDNPFDPYRITVFGNPKVNYRSVLYLPLMVAEREAGVAKSPQSDVTNKVVDCCLGVICVHCSSPYRFWRWGDHKKSQDSGGFGNVVYERSMPYIALVTKLLEPTAARVRLG